MDDLGQIFTHTQVQLLDPDGWVRANAPPPEFIKKVGEEPLLRPNAIDMARMQTHLCSQHTPHTKGGISKAVNLLATNRETFGIHPQTRVIDFKPFARGKKQPFNGGKLRGLIDPELGAPLSEIQAKVSKIYKQMGNADMANFDLPHFQQTLDAYFYLDQEYGRYFCRFGPRDGRREGWNEMVENWERWEEEFLNEEFEEEEYEDWKPEREYKEVRGKVYRRKEKLCLEL